MVLIVVMMLGMTTFAATTAQECHDYNTATNITRTYGEITFQTPAVWGEPSAVNGAFLWNVPEGYIMLSYSAIAGMNPLVITNEEITTIPLTSLAAMALTATNIQLSMLPSDNRNTCTVTATGSINNIPGTYTYAIVNSSTGIYSLQYFRGAAAGISRANDLAQVLNSITFAGSTSATSQTSTTVAASTTKTSGYKYPWANWKAAKDALYQERDQKVNAIYRQYPRWSATREAALKKLYAEYDALENELYNYYHQYK